MALPADFSKIFGSTATGGLTPISDVDYAKGWEYVGANPPTKNDFSYLQNTSDLKAQFLYNLIKPKVLAGNGFVRIPDMSGGMILQWGQVSASISEGPQAVTFPTPFPAAGRFAVAIPINQSGLTTIDLFAQLQGLSLSGATFFFSWGTSSTPANGFQWFALGY